MGTLRRLPELDFKDHGQGLMSFPTVKTCPYKKRLAVHRRSRLWTGQQWKRLCNTAMLHYARKEKGYISPECLQLIREFNEGH